MHYPIPDLLRLQQQSFEAFVRHGIRDALIQTTPLHFQIGVQKLEVSVFPECIRFRKPDMNPKDARDAGKTYGCSVYVPALIRCDEWNEVKVEWLFLGFLPCMTREGHFLINGISRVVLHQLVRTPGMYVLNQDSRTRAQTLRIVPEQGSWMNIILDKDYKIWMTTRILRRKVPILVFFQALGISLDELKKRVNHAEILDSSSTSLNLGFNNREQLNSPRQQNVLRRARLNKSPQNQEEAWRYLYAHFLEYSPRKTITMTSREFFWKIIWNMRNRKIGASGRDQLCEKFGRGFQKSKPYLDREDMVFALQALLELVFSERPADDIDHLGNKRVRGCGDFLQDELVKGVREFQVLFNRKLLMAPSGETESLWESNRSALSKTISKAWKSFFTSGTISQFMDETNPLAEITHKRRVTVLGPGGVSSKQTTIHIRGIHPTSYGRFCPIETPEGKNAGLVSSLTLYAQPNSLGRLATPFYTVYKGQVQKNIAPTYYVPREEQRSAVAPMDLSLSRFNTLPKMRLPVRKDWNFDSLPREQMNRQSVGILQMISVATSLIPFLEHNDGNRALMGSNMQRQAVPLIHADIPRVRTGLESRVISDIQYGVQTEQSGYITGVQTDVICVHQPTGFPDSGSKTMAIRNFTDDFRGEVYKQNPARGRQATERHGIEIVDLGVGDVERDRPGRFAPAPLYWAADQNTGITKSKSISRGQKNSTRLSLKNISSQKAKIHEGWTEGQARSKDFGSRKSFSPADRVASRHGIEQVYTLDRYGPTNQSTSRFHRPTVSESQWVEHADLLADGAASRHGKVSLGKNILIAYLPWEGYNFEDAIVVSERVVYQDLFTSLHLEYYEIEVKLTQYGLEKITCDIPTEIDDPQRDALKMQHLDDRGVVRIGTWVEEGDYLVGKVTPLSPTGPSVDSQYEKLYHMIMQREQAVVRNTSLRVPKGIEGFILDVQSLPPKEPEISVMAAESELKGRNDFEKGLKDFGTGDFLRVRITLLQRRRIQVGDKMAGRHGNKGVISTIVPIQDMPYLPDGTPVDIILNPLGVPSRMNVGQIFECLLGLAGFYLHESYQIELFDEQYGSEASRSLVYSKLYEASIQTSNPWLFEPHHPGKVKLFDGRSGEAFDQPITVGYAYMLKLVHQVVDKIHARATGPYSAITQQPVRGRSRHGGQRIGEMEVWALQAYGAAWTLQELLTIKSDDMDGRKETVFRLYSQQSLQYGQPESFKVLLRELIALALSINVYRPENISHHVGLWKLEEYGL
jgi:DNA-directed RNA polymerase beta subunit